MEINWSTFLLEMINFLVLVWILKHFLYKPIQDVIAQRKAVIEKDLADARKSEEEGHRLQARYENRLADWEKEKQQAHEELMQRLDQEYNTRLAELQTSLSAEKEKALVADKRRQTELQHKLEETALQQGAQFASRLLAAAATRETEIRLVEMVIDELHNLPAERIAALRPESSGPPGEIVIASAFGLQDELAARLREALHAITASEPEIRFEQDSELLAGVRITIGHLVLGANLQDELEGFVTLSCVDR